MSRRRQSPPETDDDTAAFLASLRRIAEATSDPDWLRHQSAADLAQLSGLLFDQVMVLLPTVGYSLAEAGPYVPLSPRMRILGLAMARQLIVDSEVDDAPGGRK